MQFAPRYPDVIAHHVTLRAATSEVTPLPTETAGAIVGVIDDGAGVEVLVVSIGGTTKREDGGTYHITWSLDRGRERRAIESNDVIARLRWRPLPDPIPVRLRSSRFLVGAALL